MNKGLAPYYDDIMNAARFVISINDVILNCSCRDIKVEASYVKSLHKTELLNSHFYVITLFIV